MFDHNERLHITRRRKYYAELSFEEVARILAERDITRFTLRPCLDGWYVKALAYAYDLSDEEGGDTFDVLPTPDTATRLDDLEPPEPPAA